MPRLAFLFAVVWATASPALAQLNPFSAVITAVETAAEDRVAADIAADTKMKAALVTALTDKIGKEGALIGVDVYEQDILLTGTVSTKAVKDQAGKIAQGMEGAKKLYNELLLDADVKSDKSAAGEFVDDTVIEKKINALFLEAKGINVTNYRWRSVKGRVFLFGRALSKEENDKATQVAKSIAKVVSVTNRAKIKPKAK
ncbi:MAG: BON domain-containing protein [Rhodospirillales bacterium]|nr:BON domain-containing protein [Rhodospirillales bacterium]